MSLLLKNMWSPVLFYHLLGLTAFKRVFICFGFLKTIQFFYSRLDRLIIVCVCDTCMSTDFKNKFS